MTGVRAPGRVNLIGDHTDYNDGLRACRSRSTGSAVVAARPRADGRVGRAASEQLAGRGRRRRRRQRRPARGRRRRGAASSPASCARWPSRGRPPVGARRRAVARRCPPGPGCRRAPRSSVALDARARATRGGLELGDRRDVGPGRARRPRSWRPACPAGSWTSSRRCSAWPGHALLLDCRDASTSRRSRCPGAHAVLVVHSGVARTLAGSAYAERRAACEAAARAPRARRAPRRDRSTRSPTTRSPGTSSPRTHRVARLRRRAAAGRRRPRSAPLLLAEPREPARRLRGLDARARPARRPARRARRDRRPAHRRRLRRLRRRARAAGDHADDCATQDRSRATARATGLEPRGVRRARGRRRRSRRPTHRRRHVTHEAASPPTAPPGPGAGRASTPTSSRWREPGRCRHRRPATDVGQRAHPVDLPGGGSGADVDGDLLRPGAGSAGRPTSGPWRKVVVPDNFGYDEEFSATSDRCGTGGRSPTRGPTRRRGQPATGAARLRGRRLPRRRVAQRRAPRPPRGLLRAVRLRRDRPARRKTTSSSCAVQDPLEPLDPTAFFFAHRKRVIKGTLKYHDSRPGGLPGRMADPLCRASDSRGCGRPSGASR